MAIEIAFPLREQIGNDGLEISRQGDRLEIGKHPSLHVLEDKRGRPLPLARLKHVVVGGDIRGIKFVQKFRVLRKHGRREDRRFSLRNGSRPLRALLKKAVQRNIETKRLSGHCRERLFSIGHESNLG